MRPGPQDQASADLSAAMHALRDGGWTFSAIGCYFGVSRQCVHQRLRRHVKSNYPPGAPQPGGYVERAELASAQVRAGVSQARCPVCGRWNFPQETCNHGASDQ